MMAAPTICRTCNGARLAVNQVTHRGREFDSLTADLVPNRDSGPGRLPQRVGNAL